MYWCGNRSAIERIDANEEIKDQEIQRRKKGGMFCPRSGQKTQFNNVNTHKCILN